LVGAGATIQVKQASTSQSGYLSSTNWNTFNNKQASLGYTPLNPANNLLDVNNTATALANLGIAIGTNVQAQSAALNIYSGISPSTNVQTLLGAANFTAFKSSLSLNNVPNVDTTNPANITQSSTYRFVSDTQESTWNGKLNLSGGTLTGSVTLVPGSTTVQPLIFQAGSLLTTPVAHSLEWDGNNLYVTQSTGPTRKTVAYIDSNISGTSSNLSGTPALPNGTTATTQVAGTNNTSLATTAFANALVSDIAYNSTSWASATGISPSKHAIESYLESIIPSSADGVYGLKLNNNSSGYSGCTSGVYGFDFIGGALYQCINGTNSVFSVATNFNQIGTGTNTTATMTIGAGGSIVPSSTGIIEATSLVAGTGTITVAGPTTTRVKTVRDAADTILELGGSYTPTGTWNLGSATISNLPSASLTGTIPSTVLGNSSVYIGSTSVALNRATGSLALTGITSIDGTAANLSGTPALPSGTTATTQAAGTNNTTLATTAYGDALVSDTAYNSTSWNGVTGIAPSKNAIESYLESIIGTGSDGAYGISLSNNTTSYSGCTSGVYGFDFIGGVLYKCANGSNTVFSSGGASTFDQLGSGTNTTATMTVGAGGSIVPSSTGIIEATSVKASSTTGQVAFSGPTTGNTRTITIPDSNVSIGTLAALSAGTMTNGYTCT
jgi:hypothetical protein